MTADLDKSDLDKSDLVDPKRFVATVGDGVNHRAFVHHGLGTKDIVVDVYEAETGKQILGVGLTVRTPDTIEVINAHVVLGDPEVKVGPIPKDGWRVVITGA